jgi:RNA polymerase sigma-70 factor (ECF subfamily)
MSSVSVRGLIARAREGDRGALDQLLDRARSYLQILARIHLDRRLRGKVDPSDVVQEVLLASFGAFASFRGTNEQALLRWLRRILSNELVDQMRRFQQVQKRDVRMEVDSQLDESSWRLNQVLVDWDHDPSILAEDREQAMLLADALEQLPEHYRDVLVFRHLMGLSFQEVADRMGRTVDSVDKLWLRAIKALRRKMKE